MKPGWPIQSHFEPKRRPSPGWVGEPELFGLFGLAPGPTRGMPPGPNGVFWANQARAQVPRGLGRLYEVKKMPAGAVVYMRLPLMCSTPIKI